MPTPNERLIGELAPNKFTKGQRVRYNHETYSQGEPDRDHGKLGVVTGVPGEQPSVGPGPFTYRVLLEGSPYPRGGIEESMLVDPDDDEHPYRVGTSLLCAQCDRPFSAHGPDQDRMPAEEFITCEGMDEVPR